MNSDSPNATDSAPRDGGIAIALTARQERRLIRPTGSKRHIVFDLAVGEAPAATNRTPIDIGLVLDRSGSMHGEPLAMAKRTALAVVERLSEADRAAVVVFDDQIETVEPLGPVTPALKARLRAALGAIDARGSTALHEGWLTGCHALAAGATGAEAPGADAVGVSRCFLLTDGEANVGETDPERIASEAAGIRANAGVSTSTLGFGMRYDEHLLGPLAVAGGGLFHHLRTPREIATALTGELGDLLQVAAMHVRLEIEASAGMTVDVVSAYPIQDVSDAPEDHGAGLPYWSVAIGDLLSGEVRHIVARFGFPQVDRAYAYTVRARVVWSDAAGDYRGAWTETQFTNGSPAECDEERRDPAVMRWVGLDHADRARLLALGLREHGDHEGANALLLRVARRIETYAGDDLELLQAVAELRELAEKVESRHLLALEAKELYFSSQRRSRGQKDYRES